MAEKLLLHIEYEAALHNRPIPWDAVAHRFSKFPKYFCTDSMR